MIYITLGTQPCDFSRCLKMVEKLIVKYNIQEEVIAQIGHTNYRPTERIKCIDFLSESDYQKCISDSRVVISHAGTGALFSAMKKGKKIIAVARLKKYGEMVNNHQTEIVQKLCGEGYILDGTYSLEEAWNKLAFFTPRKYDFVNYLPDAIKKQIDGWMGYISS